MALRIIDRSREHGTPRGTVGSNRFAPGRACPNSDCRVSWVSLDHADSRAAAVDPAAVAAGDVVNWIRNDSAGRDQLRTALGDGEFQALERMLPAQPRRGCGREVRFPFETLERALAVLDAVPRRREAVCAPLGTTFVLEFTGDFRFVKRAQPYEFDLVYQNLDRVESVRSMLIHVRDDLSPVVELAAGRPPRRQRLLHHAEGPGPLRQRLLRQGRQRSLQAGIHVHALPRGFGDCAFDADGGSLLGPSFLRWGRASRPWCRGVYHAGVHGTLDKGDSRTQGTFLHGGFMNRERDLKHETRPTSNASSPSRWRGEVQARRSVRPQVEHVRRPDVPADGSLESFRWRMEDFFDLDALKLEADSGDVQPRTASTSTSRPPTRTSTPGPGPPSTPTRSACSSSPQATCSSRSARKKRCSAR